MEKNGVLKMSHAEQDDMTQQSFSLFFVEEARETWDIQENRGRDKNLYIQVIWLENREVKCHDENVTGRARCRRSCVLPAALINVDSASYRNLLHIIVYAWVRGTKIY